jgi:dienelactone hydrolase
MRCAAARASFGFVAAVLLAVGCSASPGPAGQRTAEHRTPRASGTTPVTSVSSPDATHRARPRIGVARTYRAGWHLVTFTEPAHSGPAGPLPARQLRTEIWYPLARLPSAKVRPARGTFPVIMYAPGFMQCGRPYADLLKYWATAGYVVVVVDFPHADCLVGTAATEADLLNEPPDLSYVITAMLGLSRARHGLFAGLLNPREIAIAGQSDGGDVVAAIAGNTCCADHRVVAAAVESGAEWPPMAGVYFTRRTVPILFSQGSADTINPPGCSVDMYLADRARARYYLDLLGATHTGPYWGITRYEKVVARVTLAFFDRYVLGRAAQASVMRRDGEVPGVAALDENGGGTLTDRYCNT